MNETDVPEIVRILIDEVRRANPVGARVVQKLLTELGQFVSRELGQDTRIARVGEVRIAPLQVRDNTRDVRQLVRAFDSRVRGEYLLEKRRTRAWQSDDENWLAAAGANTDARGE